MDTPLQATHVALNALWDTFFGVQLPATYGEREAEWVRARERLALLDTNFHAVFELAGPDRARYLNAVSTGDVRNLAPATGTLGLLLNAQGHILAELETYALEDRFLLLSHASVRQRTFETLDKFIIMDDCTLTDVTGAYASCALEGPAALAVLAKAAGQSFDALPELGHAEARIAGAACRVLRRSHTGLGGVEILAPRADIGPIWTALAEAGGSPCGWDAVNALRIEAGIRWFGADFDDTTIPQDAGLEHTHISFTKGCYTGQEIVERVRSRGKLNRWLCKLEFSGHAAPGTKMLVDGKEWGHATSCAYSPACKAFLGFGYLRREHNAEGTVLQCDEGTARVVESPAKPPVRLARAESCR
jgi:folate-binding protein YgfZ